MNESMLALLSPARWVALVAATVIISLCIRAGLLDVMLGIIHFWVRACTLLVPPELRGERREEMASALWEEKTTLRDAGYGPDLIATRMAIQWLRGIPEDVVWCLRNASIVADRDTRAQGLTLVTYWTAITGVNALLMYVLNPLSQPLWVYLLTLPWWYFIARMVGAFSHWFWKDRTREGLQDWLLSTTWHDPVVGLMRWSIASRRFRRWQG